MCWSQTSVLLFSSCIVRKPSSLNWHSKFSKSYCELNFSKSHEHGIRAHICSSSMNTTQLTCKGSESLSTLWVHSLEKICIPVCIFMSVTSNWGEFECTLTLQSSWCPRTGFKVLLPLCLNYSPLRFYIQMASASGFKFKRHERIRAWQEEHHPWVIALEQAHAVYTYFMFMLTWSLRMTVSLCAFQTWECTFQLSMTFPSDPAILPADRLIAWMAAVTWELCDTSTKYLHHKSWASGTSSKKHQNYHG